MKTIEQRVEEKAEEIRAMFPIVNHANKMLDLRLAIKACELILDALISCDSMDHELISF